MERLLKEAKALRAKWNTAGRCEYGLCPMTKLTLSMSSRSPSDVATNAKQLRTFLEKGKTSLVDVDHKVRNRILTYVSKEKDI